MLLNDDDLRTMGPEQNLSPQVRAEFPYSGVIEDCPICNYVYESWQTNPEIRNPNRVVRAKGFIK